jgi:hypothetical protein
MKNVFLLIVVPVLLVTLGFGQNPAPPSNTDQASIKGCLAGTDGNYTVAEDGTSHSFRITSSTVDLKPHVGHDVEIIGQKANVSANASPSDNSVIATGVNMISDHCATATASAPANPASPATASAPAASTDTTTTTSTATASTPAVADSTPTATVSAPVVADSSPAPTPAPTSAPVATASMPTETAAAPMTMASAKESTKQLPETASSLPLVGLLGLGLLGIGLLIGRLRTN